MNKTPIINNRRAHFDYSLGDKIVAGLVLTGREVMHIRHQRVSLKNAFVRVDDRGIWLKNLQIFALKNQAPLTGNNQQQLLLTKAQIRTLRKNLQEKYNTIIPLKLILGRYIKLEIAPGIGRKRYDKRELLKKRSSQLKIKRQLKTRSIIED